MRAVESKVYQRTVDWPDEWANGHHVMLDTEKLVTVRWEQVQAEFRSRASYRSWRNSSRSFIKPKLSPGFKCIFRVRTSSGALFINPD